MNARIISTILFLFAVSLANAQGITEGYRKQEAFRLSNTHLQGTARANAMGNAFGALGSDFSSASINPAGLGFYLSNELNMTVHLGNTINSASYLGTKTTDNEYNFSIPSFAYVTTFKNRASNNSSLVSVNVGIGFNRHNDYNMSTVIRGSRANSSMLDQWAYNLNNGIENPYYEGLGMATGLLYDYDGKGSIYHDMQKNQYDDGMPVENFKHDQLKTTYQSGSQNEYIFSIASNFNHKLYLGATLGVLDVRYEEDVTMAEGNIDYENQNFNIQTDNYSYTQQVNRAGTGVSFKIGAVYRPINSLRLGVALHAPTAYWMQESYYAYMTSDIKENGVMKYEKAIPDFLGEYDYTVRTPMKALFSAAYIIGKKAILSADYEYVNYANMKLRKGGDGYNFLFENQDIKSTYQAVGNLRVGAEFKFTPAFSLRGGFEYLPNPYKLDYWADETKTYSTGFGYKFGKYYLDAAYKFTDNNYKSELYQIPHSVISDYDKNIILPDADIQRLRHQFMLTFGMRF